MSADYRGIKSLDDLWLAATHYPHIRDNRQANRWPPGFCKAECHGSFLRPVTETSYRRAYVSFRRWFTS